MTPRQPPRIYLQESSHIYTYTHTNIHVHTNIHPHTYKYTDADYDYDPSTASEDLSSGIEPYVPSYIFPNRVLPDVRYWRPPKNVTHLGVGSNGYSFYNGHPGSLYGVVFPTSPMETYGPFHREYLCVCVCVCMCSCVCIQTVYILQYAYIHTYIRIHFAVRKGAHPKSSCVCVCVCV